jgi:hypothetical protein
MTTTRPPARIVPLLYLGAAHVALACACVLVGWWPRAAAGFFYHSWMVAIVHLVTLGWISFSILGAIYVVGPLALRMEMPARRADYVAYGFALVGLIGMVAHFWIEEYDGMAWSAATVACGILYMAARIAVAVRRANVQPGVKLHVALACVNIWIAASMGVLVAIDKVEHILPGFVLSNVFAHAHLAVLGWATMMVVGVAYRLLPMTFPSRMPAGRSTFASAILLETGVLGLFATLLLRSAWAVVFGLTVIAGLGVFAAHVVWMLRRPALRPPGVPRLDFGVLHAASAGLSLMVAAAIGLMLLVLPLSPRTLHAAAAYGVLGLVGCLSQMVVAMEARLLPMVTWFWSYERNDYRVPPPSPHVMRDRALQAIVFAGWSVAVPTLALGLYLESAAVLGIGAWSLFAAVVVGTSDNVFVLRHMMREHPEGYQAQDHEVRKQERRHRRRAAQNAFEQRGPGLA